MIPRPFGPTSQQPARSDGANFFPEVPARWYASDMAKVLARLTSRSVLRFAALGCVAVGLVGCPTPPPRSEQAGDAVRELNLAARWGRLDVAVAHAAPKAREGFLKRRSTWGTDIRILDTQLAALELSDSTHAKVQVDVSWVRADESRLRITRLEQSWSDEDGGWKMLEEERLGGDLGLFGEEAEREAPRPDKHYPTRVIR